MHTLSLHDALPILESQIKNLDLVTREEFEVQEQVLKRTREKLEELEKHLDKNK